MPTVIIADAADVICWIDVHRDYTTRTEPDQILRAITQCSPRHLDFDSRCRRADDNG